MATARGKGFNIQLPGAPRDKEPPNPKDRLSRTRGSCFWSFSIDKLPRSNDKYCATSGPAIKRLNRMLSFAREARALDIKSEIRRSCMPHEPPGERNREH